MSGGGVSNRFNRTTTTGNNGNGLRKDWRKTLIGPRDNGQFRSRNKVDLREVERGSFYFLVGVTKNLLMEREKKESITLDLVEDLVWLDAHSNLVHFFGIKNREIGAGTILAGTAKDGSNIKIAVTAINGDKITGDETTVTNDGQLVHKHDQSYRIRRDKEELDIYCKLLEKDRIKPLVVVFDLPQAETNYKYIYDADERTAEKCAITRGREKKEEIEIIAKALNLDIRVETFEFIKNNKQFEEIYSILKERCDNDPKLVKILLPLMPPSVKDSIRNQYWIRKFKWDNKSKIPLSKEEKDRYLNSQNKYKEYLEPYFKNVYLKGKSGAEREREISEFHINYEMRLKGAFNYILQEVAAIIVMKSLMKGGVKIGGLTEGGYDNLTRFVLEEYGHIFEEHGIDSKITIDSRYFPPSMIAKGEGSEHEPTESYDVFNEKNRITTKDDVTAIDEKLKRIPREELEFTIETLKEFGASNEEIAGDLVGPIYDRIIKPIQDAENKIIMKENRRMERLYAIARLCGVDGKTVLIMGCGRGELINPLERMGGRVTGLTPSQEEFDDLIEVGREGMKFGLLDEKGLGTKNGLHFKDKCFDIVVFAQYPHQHFPRDALDQQAFLLEAWRVLKPGGKMVFLEPKLDNNLINDTLRNYIKERRHVVTKWKPKIEFLTADGRLQLIEEGLIEIPYYFHTGDAVLKWIVSSGKTIFYNLNPPNSERIETIKDAISKLPMEDEFVLLPLSVKVIVTKKWEAPPHKNQMVLQFTKPTANST